ncbi:hypothetical protein [Acinetobacter schindleri]|uniref:Uncharacterized protein n=1 Tax=Acinetobacter schindleri TaxID=108981 RepID=A0AAE6WUW8_9GAMM|nr:hypothetical protein [Acinetobacter schindleri]QIC67475.1 hypothetical protein FSC10_08830 [Acinetobacter schindleri]
MHDVETIKKKLIADSAEICLKYIYLYDEQRALRWTNVSHCLNKVDHFFVVTIQQLGRLDSRLVLLDSLMIRNNEFNQNFEHYIGEHLMQSYLWVLGAYEAIRTLNDRDRSSYKEYSSYQDKIMKLKHTFERLRIPLAKFEPSKKHKATDNHIAYPGFNSDNGAAWQVSCDQWITRRELSDRMIELFEEIDLGSRAG